MKKFKITIKDLEKDEILLNEETDGILGTVLKKDMGETKQIFLTECSGAGILTLIDSTERHIEEIKAEDPALALFYGLFKTFETKKDNKE